MIKSWRPEVGAIPDPLELAYRSDFYQQIIDREGVEYRAQLAPLVTVVPSIPETALAHRFDSANNAQQQLDAIIRVGSFGIGVCTLRDERLPQAGMRYLVKINEAPHADTKTKVVDILLPGDDMIKIGGPDSDFPEIGAEGQHLRIGVIGSGPLKGLLKLAHTEHKRLPLGLITAAEGYDATGADSSKNPLHDEVRTWQVSTDYLRRLRFGKLLQSQAQVMMDDLTTVATNGQTQPSRAPVQPRRQPERRFAPAERALTFVERRRRERERSEPRSRPLVRAGNVVNPRLLDAHLREIA